MNNKLILFFIGTPKRLLVTIGGLVITLGIMFPEKLGAVVTDMFTTFRYIIILSIPIAGLLTVLFFAIWVAFVGYDKLQDMWGKKDT